MVIGLVVPVLSNFKGLAELMASVDEEVNLQVIPNWRENYSVAASWNLGISKLIGAGVERAIIVNDDVVFHSGTMSKLVNALDDYEADLVSCVASDTGQHGLHEDGFPDYCCYAIKPAEFVEKFGHFDQNFRQAYFEDNDMHYRMHLSGGKMGLLLDARVDHEGSVTQFPEGRDSEQRVVSHHTFRMNREYYIGKWGGPPGSELNTTPFKTGGDLRTW